MWPLDRRKKDHLERPEALETKTEGSGRSLERLLDRSGDREVVDVEDVEDLGTKNLESD